MCSAIFSQSSGVTIFLRISCVLSRSKNRRLNLLRNLPTNLLNISSSLRISDDLPKLNPLSAPILDSGTLSERYNFFWKYSISVSSPKFCPPGNVDISVPLPPSLLGNQKSSSIDRNFLSSLISPVLASYTNLFLYLLITSRRYCSALTLGKLPTSI